MVQREADDTYSQHNSMQTASTALSTSRFWQKVENLQQDWVQSRVNYTNTQSQNITIAPCLSEVSATRTDMTETTMY